MYTDIYTASLSPELAAMAETPAIRRLQRVGMHCGCEYTAYPIYRDAVAPYSRHTHSLGTAAIVWHFTHDLKQSVAGLLHDIATPAFAHVAGHFFIANNEHVWNFFHLSLANFVTNFFVAIVYFYANVVMAHLFCQLVSVFHVFFGDR